MRKLALLAILATITVNAYDGDVRGECEEQMNIAISAKGTPMQNMAYDNFIKCNEPDCYSDTGAFENYEGCSIPSYIDKNGYWVEPDYIEALIQEERLKRGMGH